MTTMPTCSKCHQKVATVYFTSVMDGAAEQLHFCKDCAPATGFEGLTLEQITAISVVGKKCAFCGEAALSGVSDSNSTTYWCFDCGLERGRVISELLASKHPDWKQQFAEHPAISTNFQPEFMAWAEAASQKANHMLRDRRRQEGRDKDG